MKNVVNAIQRGIAAAQEAAGPQEYEAAGKKIVCLHCGGTRFDTGKVVLSGMTSALLNLTAFDKEATFLACSICGRLEWFVKAPEEL